MESALIECPREFSRNQSAVNYRGRLRKQRLASQNFQNCNFETFPFPLAAIAVTSRSWKYLGSKKKKNFLPRTSDKGAISSKLGLIHAVRENPRWKKGREEKVAPYYL